MRCESHKKRGEMWRWGVVSEFLYVFQQVVGKNHYFCTLSLVHLLRIQKLVMLGKEGDKKTCLMISST